MSAKITADDRLEIQELLYGYAWALDTGDVDRFVALFADDAVLVWDAFDEPCEWHGHAEIRHFVSYLRDLPSTAGRQHHVSNVIVAAGADRDHARATAYVVVIVRQDEGPSPVTVMGWYDDAFVRGADGWRIARHVIRDWTGPVLHRLAGQTGERVGRARPPVLDGLIQRPR
ncbi:MAG: nuclear transport factor 2 family protein [Rhodocyclaceae bacterium]|nr:nuclear transport factor 2 family protein [Rhodocyclaceae bacterium]